VSPLLATSTSSEASDDGRGGEGSEAKPEEGGGGLGLAALLLGAASNVVAVVVVRVAAAVHVQVSGSRDTADEPKDGVEDVEHEREDGVHGPSLLNAGGEQEEQAEHAEDGAEEVVVDHGAAAARRDEVAGQCHDEERPDKGKTAHGNVDDACGAHFDGIELLC